MLTLHLHICAADGVTHAVLRTARSPTTTWRPSKLKCDVFVFVCVFVSARCCEASQLTQLTISSLPRAHPFDVCVLVRRCLPLHQLAGHDVKSIWGAPQSESDIRDVFVAYIDGRIPMVRVWHYGLSIPHLVPIRRR